MDKSQFWYQVGLTVVDKGLLALVLAAFGFWLNRKLEAFKSTLSRQQEFSRTANAAVVDLTKKLAAGSNVISWLSWNATQPVPSLVQADFEKYETQMMAVLSDLVGLQASVAALASDKFPALSPFAEELYKRDIDVAKAKPMVLNPTQSIQQAGIAALAQIYRDALAFDRRLLKTATGLILQ